MKTNLALLSKTSATTGMFRDKLSNYLKPKKLNVGGKTHQEANEKNTHKVPWNKVWMHLKLMHAY